MKMKPNQDVRGDAKSERHRVRQSLSRAVSQSSPVSPSSQSVYSAQISNRKKLENQKNFEQSPCTSILNFRALTLRIDFKNFAHSLEKLCALTLNLRALTL